MAVTDGTADAEADTVPEGADDATAVASAVATAVAVAVGAAAVAVGVVAVVLSEGDLLVVDSSLQDAETAAPVMTAARSATCAARESPNEVVALGWHRRAASQNGQRASVSWTCR